MDLSFRPLLPERALDLSPAELAVLLATATAVQQAGATARAQAILDEAPAVSERFAPVGGSFDAAVAATFRRWREEDRRRDRGSGRPPDGGRRE